MMEQMLQILMAAVGTFGYGILVNLRGKKLLLATLGGGFSWALYLLLAPWYPDEPIRFFFCSSFAAVYAEVLARVLKTPAASFLIPCLIPMVPGGSLYHTMRFGLNREWSNCLSRAFYTLKLALALALGIIAVLSVLGVIQVLREKLQRRQKQEV